MTLRELLRDRAIARYVATRTFQSFGRGIETAILVIFLVDSVGLSPAQVGVGTSAAAFAGLLIGFPTGVIADRLGVKKTLLVLQAVQVLAMVAMVFIFNFATYLVSVCVFVAAFTAGYPVAQALAGQVTNEHNRAKAMALARAGVNAGYAVGSLLSFPYLIIGTVLAGRISLALAAAFLLCALLVVWGIKVPDGGNVARPGLVESLKVVGDTRYLAMALLMSATNMVYHILNIGVPLWVAFHGDLSNSLVSFSLLLNTAIVIALQFPLGGRVTSVSSSRTAMIFVGAGLSITCVLMGLGLGVESVVWSTVILMSAVAALSVSEVLQSAAAWELSFSFADPARRTSYLAIFTMTSSVCEMVGPLLISTFVMEMGAPGWYALGAGLALIGFIIGIYVTQYHKRYRVRTVEVSEF